MINIFALSLTFTLITGASNVKVSYASPPSLCSLIFIVLFVLLCIPIVGLTGFHIVLVVRARTTNEQVTGKFRSGYNPFTRGCWQNILKAVCTSQYPRYISPITKYVKQSDSLSVLYVPDNNSHQKDGHVKDGLYVPLTRKADLIVENNRKSVPV